MMYISPGFLIVLYVYIEFSETALRISSYDASPKFRKPRSVSETETSATGLPPLSPESRLDLRPLDGVKTSFATVSPIVQDTDTNASTTATTPHPPATDFIAPARLLFSPVKDQTSLSRLSGARKRSADVQQTSVFTPEKMLQTMVAMVSQRTANDAWSADNIGTSLTSAEHVQEPVCNCSSGSEGVMGPEECDPGTGQCSCLPGYAGLQCDECEEGHFTNGTSVCLACGCDSFGALSQLCDSSGTCTCKTGVFGPKCDDCRPGFFHFSSTGCKPCRCHGHTAYCHPQSGVCLTCLNNTQGSNCELCKPGSYRNAGAPPTDACLLCPCSNASSTGSCHSGVDGVTVCDQCLPQYSGPTCATCAPGFYRATAFVAPSTCVPCGCHGNAELCHPDTGRCAGCVNGTGGDRCQLCAPGFTGDALAHNCTWQGLPAPHLVPTPAPTTSTAREAPVPTTPSPTPAPTSPGIPTPTPTPTPSPSPAQSLVTSLRSPTDNATAALTEVSWTQFNVVVLAVITLVVLLLLGFVGAVYAYREYQNRKLNAPFWTIELKEDNISFSSYHDSIPNADVSGLLEDEGNDVAPNGQLALTTQGSCYKV